MILRLTKQFSFEMAHALPAYDGKCRNIHGHSYKLFVTVEGMPLQQAGTTQDGMVLDFSRLKALVTERVVTPFDHALVLPGEDGTNGEQSIEIQGYPYGAKLVMLDFQPTTENLLMHFSRLLEDAMPEGVRLYSLKLYETESSCAELIL